MTEFESATLWTQYMALIVSTVTSLIIGAGQVLIVLYGIRQMVQSNKTRAAAMKLQDDQNERRHQQTMQAWRALILRTGGPFQEDPKL